MPPSGPCIRWIVVGAASQFAVGALLILAGEAWAGGVWMVVGSVVGAVAGEALAALVTARRMLREARVELARSGFRIAYDPATDPHRSDVRPVHATGTEHRLRGVSASVQQGSDAA